MSTTFPDGYKLSTIFMLGGREAVAKGRHSAEMIIRKTRRVFGEKGWADYRDVSIEVIGGEATYGPHARTADSREVVVKIAAKHDQKEALGAARPRDRADVDRRRGRHDRQLRRRPRLADAGDPHVLLPGAEEPGAGDDRSRRPPDPDAGGRAQRRLHGGAVAGRGAARARRCRDGATETVPLVALAYGRSGDKGDNANIGIFARKPEYVPILDAEVTEEAVAQYFAHRIHGKVTRWRLPGIGGFNFLLRQALGGGGMASLKADPLAKAFAQMLLDMPVRVPAEMASKLAA